MKKNSLLFSSLLLLFLATSCQTTSKLAEETAYRVATETASKVAAETASKVAAETASKVIAETAPKAAEPAPYQIPPATSTEYGEFPVPGRVEGTTSFSHQANLPKMCNSGYPNWYRGKAPNGLADDESMHWYKILMGRGTKTGFNPENIMCGIFELKPGIVYPAHNHPSREFYYVISGEAEWWADDEMKNVTTGAAMYHQPFTVHGFKNTSETEPLRLFWIWWVEPEDHQDVLDIGGKFTDPDLVERQETTKAHAVPLPPVRSNKKK